MKIGQKGIRPTKLFVGILGQPPSWWKSSHCPVRRENLGEGKVSKETLSSYPTGKHGYFEPMRNLKEALAKSVT